MAQLASTAFYYTSYMQYDIVNYVPQESRAYAAAQQYPTSQQARSQAPDPLSVAVTHMVGAPAPIGFQPWDALYGILTYYQRHLTSGAVFSASQLRQDWVRMAVDADVLEPDQPSVPTFGDYVVASLEAVTWSVFQALVFGWDLYQWLAAMPTIGPFQQLIGPVMAAERYLTLDTVSKARELGMVMNNAITNDPYTVTSLTPVAKMALSYFYYAKLVSVSGWGLLDATTINSIASPWDTFWLVGQHTVALVATGVGTSSGTSLARILRGLTALGGGLSTGSATAAAKLAVAAVGNGSASGTAKAA